MGESILYYRRDYSFLLFLVWQTPPANASSDWAMPSRKAYFSNSRLPSFIGVIALYIV